MRGAGEADSGDDHENAGVLDDWLWVRVGSVIGRVEGVFVVVQVSFGTLGVAFDAAFLPRTRHSKSPSAPWVVFSVPFELLDRPVVAMSFVRLTAAVLLADNSCSFRVCSCSMRFERDFVNAINAWNCSRLSSGPRLKAHMMGKTSIARKSESTVVPMALKTSSAAI